MRNRIKQWLSPNKQPARTNPWTVYNDQASQYISEIFAVQDEALQYARQEADHQNLPGISINPEEGRFLQFLARASGGRKALEIGTLGGYSGIWIARGLLPNGNLITLEKDARHAEVARQNFAVAGLSERVAVRVGDAHELLVGLRAEGPFDFVFIDAEKPGYPAYLDWALENVRIGGVIAAHNAFRRGTVLGSGPTGELAEIMRVFNRRVATDPRLISTIFPAGDGTVIAVKIA